MEEARRNVALKRHAWRPALEILLTDLEIVPSALFDLPVSLDTAEVPGCCRVKPRPAARRSGLSVLG